jgi:hypothetical protein
LRWVSAAALVAGCFNPHLLGTRCDAQGGCPSPYTCNANHVCLLAGAGGAGGRGDPCPFSGAGAGGSSATAGSWNPTGTVPTGAGVLPILLSYGNLGGNQAIITVDLNATVRFYMRVTSSAADFNSNGFIQGSSSGVTAVPLAYPEGGTSVAVGTMTGAFMLAESATKGQYYENLGAQPIYVDALSSGFFHGGGVALYEDVVAVVGSDLYVWDATGVATDVSGYTERILAAPYAPVMTAATGRFHPDVKATDPEDLLLTYKTGNLWVLAPGSTSGLLTLDHSTVASVMAATTQPWTLTTIRRAASGKPDMVAVTNANDQNITIVAPSTVTQGDGSWPTQSRRLDGGVISVAFGHVLCAGSPALVLALQNGEIWLLPTDDGGLCSISAQAPVKIPGQGPADFVATASITSSTGPDDILVHKIGDDHLTVLTMTGCN